MLVTVVLVFLVCHSVKLIINGYEVYYLMSDNFKAATATVGDGANATSSEDYGEDYLETGSGDGDGSGSGEVIYRVV